MDMRRASSHLPSMPLLSLNNTRHVSYQLHTSYRYRLDEGTRQHKSIMHGTDCCCAERIECY